MFASSCYYFSHQNQKRSRDGSRKHCLQHSADLVVVNSAQEQVLFTGNNLLALIFLTKRLHFCSLPSVFGQKFLSGFTEVAAWVGMTDREEEGKWIWVDGTPVSVER